MKVRLKDVAALAGVAINTASTILNRRPNSWASKSTAERVFKAASDLGYRPNRAAVGLRFGRFRTFALLIPDLNNPFFTAFADLLGVETDKAGYELIIESWRTDLARERRCLAEVGDRQVDGVAAFLSDHAEHTAFLSEQYQNDRPFVVLAGVQGAPPPVDCVLFDFTTGLTEAVATLQESGHRRFAFMCALAEGQSAVSRCDLFQQILRGRGISTDDFAFARCDHTFEGARRAAAGLLDVPAAQRPSAILAMNDLSAIGALRAASERGLRVPQDLSVVGVDDIPLGRFLPTSLSTIGGMLEGMAQKTVALLLGRLDGEEREAPAQAVFPTRFIRRESIGPAPTV